MLLFPRFFWTTPLTLLLPMLVGAQPVEERIEWIYPNELTYVSFDQNPDTASTDELLNLWLSGPQGTYHYTRITAEPEYYDFQISPWTKRLGLGDTLLLETQQGLAFARGDGQVFRQTTYDRIETLRDAPHLLLGYYRGQGQVEVFRLTDRRPLLRLELASGESLSYEGGFLRRSGYRQPTRFYDEEGQLVLEEMEHTITALATNEPRFYLNDDRRSKRWLADAAGNVVAELPQGFFRIEGQGEQIVMRLGASKKRWFDLSGEPITSPVTEPLVPGEVDILYNCGVKGKLGVRFLRSGQTLPCAYDAVGLNPVDSSIVQTKIYHTRTYYRRDGERYFDPGPQTVSRYLGDGFFVLGQSGVCQFVRADGQVIVRTEVPVTDPIEVVYADYLPEPGVLMISPKYGRKLLAYDTNGQLLFTYKSEKNRALSWSAQGRNIRITEGTESFIVDRYGQEVESVRYRNPEYIYRDGQLKYIITNEIYPDRADSARGIDGLLSGVATYLIDAETEEIILSSNTGMKWIDEEHLLLYFGTTYGLVRIRG